jgi:hypothetical protein
MLAWAVHAQAQELIWSAGGSDGMSGIPGDTWEIAFDHSPDIHSLTEPFSNAVTRIFRMTLSTNDTGRTFFANAANEPGFANFVAKLTDGTNQFIRFQSMNGSGGNGWGSRSESGFLGRSSLAPDLAGYNITRIGFRVESFYDQYYAPEPYWDRILIYSLDFYTGPIGPGPAEARLALRLDPGMASLTVTGTPGAFYRFQYAETLPTTNWITWTNFYLPSASFTLFHQRPNTAARFYRAVGLQ